MFSRISLSRRRNSLGKAGGYSFAGTRHGFFVELSRSRPTIEQPGRFVPLRLTLILSAIGPFMLGLRLWTTGIDHAHDWLT